MCRLLCGLCIAFLGGCQGEKDVCRKALVVRTVRGWRKKSVKICAEKFCQFGKWQYLCTRKRGTASCPMPSG